MRRVIFGNFVFAFKAMVLRVYTRPYRTRWGQYIGRTGVISMAHTQNSKRTRADRSSTESDSSTEQLDYKRLREYLSISSADDSFTEETGKMSDPAPVNVALIMEELKKIDER